MGKASRAKRAGRSYDRLAIEIILIILGEIDLASEEEVERLTLYFTNRGKGYNFETTKNIANFVRSAESPVQYMAILTSEENSHRIVNELIQSLERDIGRRLHPTEIENSYFVAKERDGVIEFEACGYPDFEGFNFAKAARSFFRIIEKGAKKQKGQWFQRGDISNSSLSDFWHQPS